MGYEVDFLAVGEGEKSGDAIALRFGNLYGKRSEQRVVVIDGGYQESGKRLVEHIRRYYKTNRVDLVISTHPDGDHASGLSIVLEEMKVATLWMHQPWKHTYNIAKLFRDGRVTDNSISKSLKNALEATFNLEKLAKSKGIPIIEPFCGLTDSSGCLFVLGPTKDFYESQLPRFRCTPELREDAISETLDDNSETSAENDSSAIIMLHFDNRSLLFTADAGIPALTEVVDLLEDMEFDFSTLKFVQIPHHGSHRNIGPSLLNRLLTPNASKIVPTAKTAYVSAATQGAPKHPSKKVTNAFRRRRCKVYATQGIDKRHSYNAPDRPGWKASTPVPFYPEV